MYLDAPVPRGWDAPDGLRPRAQNEKVDDGGSNNTVVFIVSCFKRRAGKQSLTTASLIIGCRECCRFYCRRLMLDIHLQKEAETKDKREQEARLSCTHNWEVKTGQLRADGWRRRREWEIFASARQHIFKRPT